MRKLKCISKEYQIWEVNKFWTKDICDYVVKEFERQYDTKSFDNEEKIEDHDDLIINLADRNSKRLNLESTELSDLIWNNLDFSVLRLDGHSPIGINKSFRLYKYFIDDEFIEHIDMSTIMSDNVRTFYSILIYLNDAFMGGNTKFTCFEIKPKLGNLVTFPHNQLHSGEKVISGMKYVLRGDVIFKKHH